VTRLPDRPRKDAAPAQRLSNEEFEMVIRRAAELQARSVEEAGADGVSEEDALRIGRELGLSGAALGRALAEVRGGAVDEQGAMVKLLGPARISVSRAVAGDARALARVLEEHLEDVQYLVVQRRLADRTVFVKASGVLAAVGRTTTEIFRRAPLLGVENLDVSVRELEPGLCYVGLSTDLGGERTSRAVGGAVMGGVLGGTGALVLGIAVAPAAAVVAVPIAAASLAGWRYGYQAAARKATVQLEALLDRLEHGELPPRSS
jgi:hypothetical protein